MNSETAAQSDASNNSSNPPHDQPEPISITIQERVVVALFLIVGVVFGVILVADLLAGFFR